MNLALNNNLTSKELVHNAFQIFDELIAHININLSEKIVAIKEHLYLAFLYWMLDRFSPKNALLKKNPSSDRSPFDFIKELLTIHTDIILEFDIRSEHIHIDQEKFVDLLKNLKALDRCYGNHSRQSLEIYTNTLEYGIAWYIQKGKKISLPPDSFDMLEKIHNYTKHIDSCENFSINIFYNSMLQFDQMKWNASIKLRLFQVACHVLRDHIANQNCPLQIQIEKYALCLSQWDLCFTQHSKKSVDINEFNEQMIRYKKFMTLIHHLIKVCSIELAVTRQTLRNESISIYGKDLFELPCILTHKIYTTECFDGYREDVDVISECIEKREDGILESIINDKKGLVIFSPKSHRNRGKNLFNMGYEQIRKTSSAEELMDGYTLWSTSLKRQRELVGITSKQLQKKSEEEKKDDIKTASSAPSSFFKNIFSFIKDIVSCVIQFWSMTSFYTKTVTPLKPKADKIDSPGRLEENIIRKPELNGVLDFPIRQPSSAFHDKSQNRQHNLRANMY
ncbi:MAG: hypothetical protein FJ161_02130 [Gammaproteobacteria bacterium]|nr:hypothetical protein [Gammaproteobacteria bacterium]